MTPELIGNLEDGLRAVQNAEFCKSAKYMEQQSRANRKGANIDILDFERAFIRRMRKMHVPMFSHSIVRTEAEQDALFVQGVSKARGPAGPHVWGCAVDLIHGTKAWNIPDEAWRIIGHVGKEVAHSLGIKLVWGGDWKFYDPAHWEIDGWRSLPHAAYGLEASRGR